MRRSVGEVTELCYLIIDRRDGFWLGPVTDRKMQSSHRFGTRLKTNGNVKQAVRRTGG
ncbi:hypothetical protein BT63DRAFT_424092 [Microthyrium microscopicum]|uniref:Uncharacterized protein n=1 Tax=Microthyrium microscopicum TaxID=703497 RepID=A0A6A6UCZ7_9PEZI|nr:hypothetical protein BT63DRAFT_424092 [Microthyrium microscopicum]